MPEFRETLEIRDLAFRYPGANRHALNGVSLNAEHGQILGLLGPNGAGKTTLISHLSGLLPVQHGSISIGGQALAGIRRATPTRIAVAPQEYAFYPMLTVTENLECFASAGGSAVHTSNSASPSVSRSRSWNALRRHARKISPAA